MNKSYWFLNLATHKEKTQLYRIRTLTRLISRASDSFRVSSFIPHRISRPSPKCSSANSSDSSAASFFSSLDLSQIRGTVLRDRVEGISNSPLSGSGAASASTLTATSSSTSTSTSASCPLKARTRKVAAAVHQLSTLQELLEQWGTKSKQELYSAEDRYQVLELRDKILRIRKCITFHTLIAKKISYFKNMVPCIQGVPGGTDQTSGECSLC